MITDLENGTVFNLCSEMNPWIDILVCCDKEQVPEAKLIAKMALEDWHEDEDPKPFGDYLQALFEADGVSASIYWLQGGAD